MVRQSSIFFKFNFGHGCIFLGGLCIMVRRRGGLVIIHLYLHQNGNIE